MPPLSLRLGGGVEQVEHRAWWMEGGGGGRSKHCRLHEYPYALLQCYCARCLTSQPPTLLIECDVGRLIANRCLIPPASSPPPTPIHLKVV